MQKDILIVDDDPINLKLFTIIADKNQWSYETASDGYQVKELVQNNTYKLILLDIQLPGIDGFSLLKLIKDKNQDTYVIAVTAYAMAGDREKIIQTGADDYLPKPVNIDELVKKVEKVLKK